MHRTACARFFILSIFSVSAFSFVGAGSTAMAVDTNCGNGSNTTTPGIEIVACGLFNNAGTAPSSGFNSIFGNSNTTIDGNISTAIGAFNTVGTLAPFAGVTAGLAVGDNNKVEGNTSNAIGHQNIAHGNRMNIVGSARGCPGLC